MFFLGQAGNYRAKDIWRHTFALGSSASARRLQKHLAERYQAPISQVALYGTGRSALTAAIKATIPKNSQVIITALTCYAVVQAVKAAGCIPIFADIDTETLHYGAKQLQKTLKKYPKAKALIVQNNLGIPADMPAIRRIAKKQGLAIIEDLAHSAGIKYTDGSEAGTVGDATILSFGKGKKIDTIAGGALILRDSSLPPPKQPRLRPRLSDSLRARFYPLFGATIRGLYHFNLGSKNLGRAYTAFLLKLRFIERSADAPLDLTRRPTYWQCRLALRQLKSLDSAPLREYYLVDDRAATLSELATAGYIMYDTWYDIPVAPERYYKKAAFPEQDCPNAMDITEQIINLPTHYDRSALKAARQIINRHDISKKLARGSRHA